MMWQEHLAKNEDGVPITRRSPRFASQAVCPTPPRVDSRGVVAPSINWAAVDRTMNLQHEMTQKAIAWVLAERTCEDRSVMLVRIEDDCGPLRGKTNLDGAERDLLGKLEQAKIAFHIACRNVERCDLEFKQLARRIVDALEQDPVTVPDMAS